MNLIKVKNGVASREPLPAFLVGLEPVSLANLSWTDPALGVRDCAWWPEVDASPALGPFQQYGAETLTPNPAQQTVASVRAVVPWTQEQMDAYEAEQAQVVAEKIEALWAAADRYVASYISGVAIGILTMGVMQQKPKCMAVSEWSYMIWAEYYSRKALVTPTSEDDLDFSPFGPMPYTVPELQAEVGM